MPADIGHCSWGCCVSHLVQGSAWTDRYICDLSELGSRLIRRSALDIRRSGALAADRRQSLQQAKRAIKSQGPIDPERTRSTPNEQHRSTTLSSIRLKGHVNYIVYTHIKHVASIASCVIVSNW
eukprot:9472431-Pyramimonas_sp.AAC.1